MITPISCQLEALVELTFKNTHRVYSRILKDITAHAPNLKYLEVEFELTTTEKELELVSDSLSEVVLINPVEGLSVTIKGEAKPEFDVMPKAKANNVTFHIPSQCLLT